MRRTALAMFAAVLLPLSLLGPAASAGPPNRVDVIVVLHDDFDPAAVARDHGVDLGFVYSHALNGFSGAVPEGRMNGLQHDRRVDYVELDQIVTLAAQTVPTGIQRIFADTNSNLDIDGTDDFRVAVDVAIIDTGIDFEHPDLNVVGGVNCASGGPFGGACEPGGDDDHYHGTHVAGTVAALDNGEGVVGVAPGANLWAVKVLNKRGSGYTSWIVGGIDWVAANADTIEVANMSLGGSGFSQAEYDAISGAVNAGVAFAVAAGNEADDAANHSPAAFGYPAGSNGLPGVVLSVSALADFDGLPGGWAPGNAAATCLRADDQDDTLAYFSNYGDAVSIAAPGTCIFSTYPLERGGYDTISGTSMASPHVAGALALLASGSGDPAGRADVFALYDQVISAGSGDWIDDSGDGTQEPLLDVSGFSATLAPVGGGGGGNAAPTAVFTYSCSDLACDFDGTGSGDSDGTLAGYAWDFGDGNQATGATASHTFAAAGDYTVTLTVTDDGGATGQDAQTVTATEPPAPGAFTLDANGFKEKGRHRVELTWSGAAGDDVDVWRDGALIATTPNDSAYLDVMDSRGGATFRYLVCEAGGSVCSNEAVVIF